MPFDEAEGVDKLEALQEHSNEDIYNKAVELLEKYFGEDGDEDENLKPNIANADGFTFGVPTADMSAAAAANPLAFFPAHL